MLKTWGNIDKELANKVFFATLVLKALTRQKRGAGLFPISHWGMTLTKASWETRGAVKQLFTFCKPGVRRTRTWPKRCVLRLGLQVNNNIGGGDLGKGGKINIE